MSVELLERPAPTDLRRMQRVAWLALVTVFLAGMRGLVYRVRLQFGDVRGSLLDDRPTQVMFYAVYAVALVIGCRASRATLDRSVLMPLSAFLGVLTMSTLWSIEWGRTLNQAIQMSLASAAVVLLASALSEVRVVSALVAATSVVVVASIAAKSFGMEFSSDKHGRLTGILYNRNALGMVACSGVFAVIALWWQKRDLPHIGVLAPVVTVVHLTVWWRSGSATAMIAAVAGLGAAAWIVTREKVNRRVRPWVDVLPVLAVVTGVVSFAVRGTVTSWIGRDATFTGRTSTWGLVVDAWESRPFAGYGFFAGWFDPVLRRGVERIGFNHWEAHNGYLEVVLGVGVVGAIALAWLIVSLGGALWSRRRDPWAPTWWGFAVFALVSNVGETNIAANRLAWFVLVAVVARLATRERSPVPSVVAR